MGRLFTMRSRRFVFSAGDTLSRFFRLGEASFAEALSGFSLPIGGSLVHAASNGVRLSHRRTIALRARIATSRRRRASPSQRWNSGGTTGIQPTASDTERAMASRPLNPPESLLSFRHVVL